MKNAYILHLKSKHHQSYSLYFNITMPITSHISLFVRVSGTRSNTQPGQNRLVCLNVRDYSHWARLFCTVSKVWLLLLSFSPSGLFHAEEKHHSMEKTWLFLHCSVLGVVLGAVTHSPFYRPSRFINNTRHWYLNKLYVHIRRFLQKQVMLNKEFAAILAGVNLRSSTKWGADLLLNQISIASQSISIPLVHYGSFRTEANPSLLCTQAQRDQ